MIRTAARNATLLAAATLLVGTAAINCSGKKDREDVGSIRLALNLPGGKVINSVSFTITGNGITPITGSINVSDPSATATVLVSSIPAGTGYTVAMNAVSTDGTTTCAGSQMFDIIANQTTAVTVGLQCRANNNNGSGNINGVFNQCPTVSFTASPLISTSPSGVINVSATGMDLDAMQTLSYAWTATGGSFAAASSATTTYNCSAPGAQTLTVTVTDNFVRAGMPQPCSTSATVMVTCVPLACGNGMLDPGEQCDPPNAAAFCDQNCQRIPVCGNGMLEGAEMCDPPDGIFCDSMCRGIPVMCGNGIIQPPETCEPPNTATCNAMCRTIVVEPPRCGDGMVNQPSEQCDDGNMTAGDGCENCLIVANACEMCETSAGSIPGSACDPALVGCNVFTGTERQLCLDTLACIRTNHCAPNGDAAPCYCGTAADLACLTGTANGVCRDIIEAAALSTGDAATRAGQVSERFTDPVYPVGRARNLIACDFEACQGPPILCPL